MENPGSYITQYHDSISIMGNVIIITSHCVSSPTPNSDAYSSIQFEVKCSANSQIGV